MPSADDVDPEAPCNSNSVDTAVRGSVESASAHPISPSRWSSFSPLADSVA